MFNLSRWNGRKTWTLGVLGLALIWAQHYGLLAIQFEGQSIKLADNPIQGTFWILFGLFIRHAVGRKA